MNLRSGIKLIFESKGAGGSIRKGDLVKVRVDCWLNGGDLVFENRIGEVVVGSRGWIAGIEYALEGMKKGGVRKVKISPHLGYGEKEIAVRSCENGTVEKIGPNAVLVCEIEVLDVVYKDGAGG